MLMLKFTEYKFNPKKVDSQLNNVIVYDIETYNKERAIPYAIGFYPVSKIVSKWDRDLTQTEIDKCLNDISIFEGKIVFLICLNSYNCLKENQDIFLIKMENQHYQNTN